MKNGWKEMTIGQLVGRGAGNLTPSAYPHEVFEYYSIPAYREMGKPTEEIGTNIRSQKQVVEHGTVLFGKLNPRVEKVWLVDSRSPLRKIASTEWISIPVRPNLANPYFVYYLFWSDRVMPLAKGLVAGSTPSRQRVDPKSFFEIPVVFPSLPEQKKIAAVLLKIQQAIETQEKIIQSLRDLKKSTMQRLFTYGLRGEKIKITEIGEIPESWEVATLGELCSEDNGGLIQTGPFGSQLHASDYKQTGVPVVNPTHILDNVIIHKGIPQVSEENAKRLCRHTLEVGDILFARRGEIGRHALVGKEEAGWLCGTGCFLVRIRSPRVENDFVSWCLYTSQSQEWLLAHAAGSIMPNLNNRILRACPVTFPKLAEQQSITEILNKIGEKVYLHESKKYALQELFKTTLNKLMTGEIRVGDLDIDVSEVET